MCLCVSALAESKGKRREERGVLEGQLGAVHQRVLF